MIDSGYTLVAATCSESYHRRGRPNDNLGFTRNTWGYHQLNMSAFYLQSCGNLNRNPCPILPDMDGIRWVLYDNDLFGWWYTYPSEKYEFASWGYDIPKIWEKHVPKHQPVIYLYTLFTICSYVSESSLAPHLPAIAIRAKEV